MAGLRSWGRPRWLTWWVVLLAGVLFLGISLRAGWIAYAHPDPSDGRFDDTTFYDRAALRLAEGKGYVNLSGEASAQRPPGYSAILAAPYKLFGRSLAVGWGINVAAGALSIVLAYGIGRRVFGPRAGLAGAALLALFPGHIFFSSLLLTETVFTAVLLLLLFALVWVMDRGRAPSLWLVPLIGGAFGAAALIRSEALVLLLLAVLFWRFVVPNWRAYGVQAALLLVGAAAVIAPWTARNALVMDSFVLISSGGGHTFWMGHQEDIYVEGDPSLPQLIAEFADLPYPQREIEMERTALRRGLKFAVSHPIKEFSYLGEKVYHLFSDDSIALDLIQARPTIPEEDARNLTRVADLVYYGLFGMALVGVPLWWSLRDRRKLLLVAVAAAWVVVHLAFYPTARNHFPLIPLICLFAGTAVVALWERRASPSVECAPEGAREASEGLR